MQSMRKAESLCKSVLFQVKHTDPPHLKQCNKPQRVKQVATTPVQTFQHKVFMLLRDGVLYNFLQYSRVKDINVLLS